MESGGLCFCKLVHEIHGRVITLPRAYLLSLPGSRPDSWPFLRSAVIFSIVKKGWKDQEMVLWYYGTRKKNLSRMLLWSQRNPASPTGWFFNNLSLDDPARIAFRSFWVKPWLRKTQRIWSLKSWTDLTYDLSLGVYPLVNVYRTMENHHV